MHTMKSVTTAIVTDPKYRAHTDPAHVERAARLESIEKAIASSGLQEHLMPLAARPATEAEMTAIHTTEHLASIRRFAEQGGGYIDPDTYMNSASWDAAVLAAGGTIRLVEAIVNGECTNGFALVRPPGHHATQRQAMGFCLINNVAAAARYAVEHLGLERVAIIDYDVHHGNGTQDIFYTDPRVLYCSTHAYPFYPGTGSAHETGDGEGKGATLNVPLTSGVGDVGYERIFDQIIIPALRTWQPQMVLISAGYDAHWTDPIGPMVLSVAGYVTMTRMLADLANELCGGNIAMVLEGGYNLNALGAGVVASLQVLMGQSPAPESDPIPLGRNIPEPGVGDVIALLKRHPILATS